MAGVDEDAELLLEFFSPYCGGCQAFAPTMNKISNHLAAESLSIQVARFDITESDIPTIDGEELFRVEATPTLYRVRYAPFRVEFYEGEHEFDAILRWLTEDKKTEIARHKKVDMLAKKERKKMTRGGRMNGGR